MSVLIEKPYRFVPPHHGTGWPAMIQRLRLVDLYLRKKEGVVQWQCRHLDRLRDSVQRGHGVLLAPNHCRYADPLVLGWPARELNIHLHAMASWHLFNTGWFDAFAIRKMGAFSVWREGLDRQSIETAIAILADAKRPLIIFPEGTTNRTNDALQPLLDGVTFIARAAARRRQKHDGGSVVIHPVAIKYLFLGDIHRWADAALAKLEQRLGWKSPTDVPLLERLDRVGKAMLTIKEIECFARAGSGSMSERRDALIEHLLQPVERQYSGTDASLPVLHRVRALRSRLLPDVLDPALDATARELRRRQIADVDLAQHLACYVTGYLSNPPVTDTRLLETLQRMQENFLGTVDSAWPLKAVIEFGEAIAVPVDRAPRGVTDPLLEQIQQQLQTMLGRLAWEANLL